MILAYEKAKYFGVRHYVWGFQSSRNGKWYYTVTDYRPSFMLYTDHIT